MQYFVLIPECDPQTKLFIPVEKAEQVGLREIISPSEADKLLSFLSDSDADVSWDSDNKQRKQAYEAASKSTDLYDLARMIKELLVQETKTVLGNFEKEILPRAQKRLFSEIALAKGMRFDDTVRMACHAVQS